MRTFNYSEIKTKMWDSDILGLIAAIYKEAGKQEMYLKLCMVSIMVLNGKVWK